MAKTDEEKAAEEEAKAAEKAAAEEEKNQCGETLEMGPPCPNYQFHTCNQGKGHGDEPPFVEHLCKCGVAWGVEPKPVEESKATDTKTTDTKATEEKTG